MLQDLALIFKLNNGVVRTALDGLPADDFWRRPDAGGNPLGWMLGHITGSRYNLLNRLGDPAKTAWGNIFARGMPLAEVQAYPPREALLAAWQETHPRMRDAFRSVSAETLAEKLGRRIGPLEDPTVGETVTFLAFHEAYHAGQMGYVRRLLGHSGVAG
jgi:uncharacterized damage-inducible protein DinB